MAIQVASTKTSLAASYAALALYGALTSTAPSATTGTEISGGSPAYARIACSWTPGAAGVTTATAQVFNVAAGTTVVGYELFSASTGGTYIDGATITSQAFASQGTYSITPTFTQA